MSWVTDIILLAGLEERIAWSGPSPGTMVEEPAAIKGLNAWLKKNKWAPLCKLHSAIQSEKAFQACAYGGALNHLKVPRFLAAIAKQPWEAPGAVLLVMKNEEESTFSVYRLKDGKMVLQGP